MAGRKKQSEQTAEEKLQQALVPEAEQPYKVPDNWCWVKQNIICGLADADKISNGELPYLEVKYLRGNKEAKLVNEGKFIERSSKVILVDGENSGEVFDIPTDGYMGSTFRLLYFTNAVNEIYPGMDPIVENVSIHNLGDSNAMLSYQVVSARVLNEDLAEQEKGYFVDLLSHDFPFHINISLLRFARKNKENNVKRQLLFILLG